MQENNNESIALSESIKNILSSNHFEIDTKMNYSIKQILETIFFSPIHDSLKAIFESYDIINSIYKFGSKSIQQITKIILKETYNAHWFPNTFLIDYRDIIAPFCNIIGSIKKNKNWIKKIDSLVFKIYNKTKIEKIRKQWRKKNIPNYQIRMFYQAIQAYYRKEYAMTIAMLSTLWEEILYTKTHDIHDKNITLNKEMISFSLNEYIMYDCCSMENIPEDVLGRNAIAHSLYKKYPSQKAGLNAILFTDFLLNLEPIAELKTMDKMQMESVNMTEKNIEKIATLFPNCITESKDENGKLKRIINFETLRAMLSEDIIEGNEAYEFTWVGKKASIAEANKPIRKTLRPCKEESVNWDTTENLYIEGDNLEVLKLLQESYLGKVKMIYIDPPYNTGNDYIYCDNFSESMDEYEEDSGVYNVEGNKLFKNTDSNGRFHSDWCSMMYSRLMIARNLLSDDGVIFISIDDNEYDDLKKMADEIFSRDNILATLIWDLGTGTTAGHFTRGHEYILCYCKNKLILPNFKNPNENEIISHGALKKISYKNPAVDITFPVGFEYDGKDAVFNGELGDSEKEYILSEEMRFKDGKLVAPTTIKAGFAMKNQIEDFIAGKKVFDTKGQHVLRFYFNSNGILIYEKEKSIINPRTVLSNIANTKSGTIELENIFKEKVFEFPKPTLLLKYLIQLITDKDSIILDFFSGSATTAHAVMQLNAEDGGHRKFIMVQLPETTDEESEAYKAGYKNICEIGKERIRRAGKKIKEERPLVTQDVDFGFRVLKLDETNMEDVYYTPEEITQDFLYNCENNIKPDRTDLDLLFACLIEWGLPLSMPYSSEEIDGATVHTYNNGDLIACFDKNIPESVMTTIAKRQPLRAVFRDSSFSDTSEKINIDEIFKFFAPDTQVKVI